jgi:hypothetical protein
MAVRAGAVVTHVAVMESRGAARSFWQVHQTRNTAPMKVLPCCNNW